MTPREMPNLSKMSPSWHLMCSQLLLPPWLTMCANAPLQSAVIVSTRALDMNARLTSAQALSTQWPSPWLRALGGKESGYIFSGPIGRGCSCQ